MCVTHLFVTGLCVCVRVAQQSCACVCVRMCLCVIELRVTELCVRISCVTHVACYLKNCSWHCCMGWCWPQNWKTKSRMNSHTMMWGMSMLPENSSSLLPLQHFSRHEATWQIARKRARANESEHCTKIWQNESRKKHVKILKNLSDKISGIDLQISTHILLNYAKLKGGTKWK